MHDSHKDSVKTDRDSSAPASGRRSRLRSLLRWTGRGILAVLVLLLVSLAGLIALTRTEPGLSLLTRWVPQAFNSLDLGLRMELGALSGPLPEDLRIYGLRLSDRRGIWLEVPSAHLALRPASLLPRGGGWTLEAERLRVSGARFLRPPDLPPSAPTPPSPPEPLSLLPSWLAVKVETLRVNRIYLGPELLGTPGLALSGDLRGSADVAARTAKVRLEVPRLRPESEETSEKSKALSAAAVKSELAPFLEQLTGKVAKPSSEPSRKQSLPLSPKSSAKQSAEKGGNPSGGAGDASPAAAASSPEKQDAVTGQSEKQPAMPSSKQSDKQSREPSKRRTPEIAASSRPVDEKGLPLATFRATLDADLADDVLTVRLDARDEALLPHFAPALDGALLRLELRAHAPLLPPAPKGPLGVRLRGAFAVRAAGQADFGQMSDLGVDLRWDGARLTVPHVALAMPGTHPQLTLRGGGGLDPELGPGANLTAGVRDLRTLGVLLGLSPKDLAGAVTARLELGHGRKLYDWWSDGVRDSGGDGSPADSGDGGIRRSQDGSKNTTRNSVHDGIDDNRRDSAADDSGDGHADGRDDGARGSHADSDVAGPRDGKGDGSGDRPGKRSENTSGRSSEKSPDERSGTSSGNGSRDSAAQGSDDGDASRHAPLRVALDVVGSDLLLPGGPVEELRVRFEGDGAPGASVAEGLPDAASGTLRIAARSLFGLGAAQASTKWEVAGLRGADLRGVVRGLDARIPGLQLSGDLGVRLPRAGGASSAPAGEDLPAQALSSDAAPATPANGADNAGGAVETLPPDVAGPPAPASPEVAWPLLDGALDLGVTDWQALARLIRTPLSGDGASLRLEVRPEDARQRVALHWDMRRFRAADTLRLAFCKGRMQSADLYGVIEGLLSGPPEAVRRETPEKAGSGKTPEKMPAATSAATLDGSLELGAGSAGPVRWDSGRATVRVRDEQGTFEAVLRGPVDATVRGSYHFGDRLLRMNVLEVSDAARGLGLRLNRPTSVGFRQGLEVDDLGLTFSPQGSLGLRALLSPEKLRLEASVDDLPLDLARKLADVPLYGGTLSARIAVGGAPAAPTGRIGLTLAGVPLSDVPGAPKAGLAVTGELERAGRGGVHNLRLSAKIDGIEGLGPVGDNEGLTATASVPLRFDPVPSVAMTAPFAARVFWRGDVAPLWRLAPLPGRSLSGRGEITATAGGTLQAPRLDAGVFMGGGRYVDRLEGVVLTDIALEARYAADGVSVLRLAAGDGRGGTLALDGSLTDLLSRPQVAARGLIRNLRPLHRDDLAVQLSGALDVSGPLSSPLIRANIRMDQGAFQILNNFGGGVTTLDDVTRGVGAQPCREDPFASASGQAPLCREGAVVKTAAEASTGRETASVGASASPARKKGKNGAGRGRGRKNATGARPAAAVAEPAPPPAGMGPRLDIKVTAPGKFFIRGKGLESEWKADLTVKGTVTQPELVGYLAPVRGQFDLLGRTFEFEQGDITFNGGNPPNPLLNLTLEYQGPQITALVMVRGTARRPRLDLSSQPVLPKDEIMAQILFGKSMSSLSRFETIQAAAAAAQLIGGGPGALDVLSKTRDLLGLQVLRFGSADDHNLQHTAPRDASQQGTVSDSAAQAPTLEAGKYVLDNVYVGVEQGTEPGTGTTVHVNIDLFPHVSVEGRTSNESSGVGINWKLDY